MDKQVFLFSGFLSCCPAHCTYSLVFSHGCRHRSHCTHNAIAQSCFTDLLYRCFFFFFPPVPVPQMTTLEIRQKSNHNLLALRKQMTLFGCQILLLVLVLFSACIVTRADTQVKPDDLNAFISQFAHQLPEISSKVSNALNILQ